jgi:hypothetical protein
MVIAGWRQGRLPLSRDQLFLLLAALNHIFMAIDIVLAHSISGGIKPTEWIPIVFGMVAGFVLLFAGALAARNRSAATILANLVFIASITVGVLGAYFHLNRTVLLAGDLISLQAVSTLVWAPPAIGPMFFVLIGVLGISAAWIESPVDSGRLRLLGERTVQMPYSKTRAYMLIVALFMLATLISSVLDHARLSFENPWVWLPLAAALFGLTTSLFIGIVEAPSSADLATHVAAMLLLVAVGLVGFVFHAEASTTAAGHLVVERFLRGSPILAPLLFVNAGVMGLLPLLPPDG